MESCFITHIESAACYSPPLAGRGSQLVVEALHLLAKLGGVKWDLHTPWRPQSSGKVERMKQSLKGQMSKICQEPQREQSDAFPSALLQIQDPA